MTHAQETLGLPSASSGEIFYSCAGSLQLEKEAPPETPSTEAIQGSEIAEALASDEFAGLDETGRTIAENLREQRLKALDEWQKQFDEPTSGLTFHKEVRFWIRDRTTQAKVASAKPDFAAIGKRAALSIDEKTGYLRVTSASRNIQARIQALSLWHVFPKLQNVRAIISAYRFRGRVDPVDYNLATLGEAERELFFNLWRTQQPHAVRTAGKWCRYCKGLSICDQNAAMALLPVVHTGPEIRKKADVEELVRRLTTPQKAFIQERKTMITNFLDANSDSLRALPAEELASVGLQLVPGGNVRVIPSVQAMWNVLFGLGAYRFTIEEFQQCLKATVTAIEEKLVEKIMAADKGLLKKEALFDAKKIMEPAVELRPKNPSLKPIKGALSE